MQIACGRRQASLSLINSPNWLRELLRVRIPAQRSADKPLAGERVSERAWNSIDIRQKTRRKRIRFENRIGFPTLSAKRITKEVNKAECASARTQTHTGVACIKRVLTSATAFSPANWYGRAEEEEEEKRAHLDGEEE